MNNSTRLTIEVTNEQYTEELLREQPNSLFIFGDNLVRKGKGGQACIRDSPNSFGIPTKKLPTNNDDAFFTDDDFTEFAVILKDRLDLLDIIGVGRLVKLPSGGLGTGLAQLPKRAPKLYKHLIESLNRRFNLV